jgi:hypothetical protein
MNMPQITIGLGQEFGLNNIDPIVYLIPFPRINSGIDAKIPQ